MQIYLYLFRLVRGEIFGTRVLARRAAPSIRGRTLFVRWCRGEPGAEHRGAQGRAFEVGLCLSGDVGERLVRRTVARRAERSRSDFVCPGDVCKLWVLSSSGMGRFWRIFCVNVAQKWRGNFVKRSNELSEQSEERLAAQRKRAAVKVSNECSKDREERLRAKREREAAEEALTTSLPSLRGKPASLISLSRS